MKRRLHVHGVISVYLAVVVALAGLVGSSVPVAAHGNTCTTGNSNFVAIVFEHHTQGGQEDLCWKDGQSRDEVLAVNESALDDVGENANFHDKVSSPSLKNNGGNWLCIKFYHEVNRSDWAYSVKLPANYGDWHKDQVPHNDAYDSIDLTHQGGDGCFGP